MSGLWSDGVGRRATWLHKNPPPPPSSCSTRSAQLSGPESGNGSQQGRLRSSRRQGMQEATKTTGRSLVGSSEPRSSPAS
eukprot:2685603-Alexandrium_andersonii.AAC.1